MRLAETRIRLQRDHALSVKPDSRCYFPAFFVRLLAAFSRFAATRCFTILVISSYGIGWPSGNWTVPLDTL
ncbi:hypothetical protein D3C85_1866640 [compost metagenome]